MRNAWDSIIKQLKRHYKSTSYACALHVPVSNITSEAVHVWCRGPETSPLASPVLSKMRAVEVNGLTNHGLGVKASRSTMLQVSG